MKNVTGYCAYCGNNPKDISLTEASKIEASECFGCWFTEEKQNWVESTNTQDEDSSQEIQLAVQ